MAHPAPRQGRDHRLQEQLQHSSPALITRLPNTNRVRSRLLTHPPTLKPSGTAFGGIPRCQAWSFPDRAISAQGAVSRVDRTSEEPSEPDRPHQRLERHPQPADHPLRRPPSHPQLETVITAVYTHETTVPGGTPGRRSCSRSCNSLVSVDRPGNQNPFIAWAVACCPTADDADDVSFLHHC